MVEFWFPCWIMFVTQEVLSSTYKCFLLASSMCEFFLFPLIFWMQMLVAQKVVLMVLITNVFATNISHYQDTGKKGKKKLVH